MYEELGDDQFEVIFVSFDRTEDAQKEYMHELHGDWTTIPFGDALIQWAKFLRISKLKKNFRFFFFFFCTALKLIF